MKTKKKIKKLKKRIVNHQMRVFDAISNLRDEVVKLQKDVWSLVNPSPYELDTRLTYKGKDCVVVDRTVIKRRRVKKISDGWAEVGEYCYKYILKEVDTGITHEYKTFADDLTIKSE